MSTLQKVAIAGVIAAAALTFVVRGQMHRSLHVMEPARIEIPEAGISLPMRDERGLPVVEVTIHGTGPHRFILDTAASVSVIATSLSKTLSLEPLKNVSTTSTGRAPQGIVQIDELHVGAATLGGVYAAVVPLEEFFPEQSGPRGVLAAPGFPGYLVTFDYPRKLISIQKGSLEAADGQGIFEYSADKALPALPFRIAGREIWLDLDTGSIAGLLLPSKWANELSLASTPHPVKSIRTPAGDFPSTQAKVDGKLELGRYKLDPQEVAFSDAHGGSGHAAGQVGYEVLRHFVVTLDSKNRRIRLEQ